MYHVHAWGPWRPESIRSPGTGATTWMLGTEPRSFQEQPLLSARILSPAHLLVLNLDYLPEFPLRNLSKNSTIYLLITADIAEFKDL